MKTPSASLHQGSARMALRVTHLHLRTSMVFSLFSSSSSSSFFTPSHISLPRITTPLLCFCSSSSSSLSSAMSSTESSPLTRTITLPSQPSNSVQIIAAPGISDSEFRSAIESSLFQQWLKNLQGEKGALTDGAMSLNKVLIQGVDYFGQRVGFLKFKAEVVHKEMGQKVPGIVFARGPAVAILILLESEGESYAVLTEQVRVPTGRFLLELPAGMLDDDKGDFVGTAAREVEEETGIHLNVADMVELTAFLDPATGCKVFPSPGGCDEEISVFLYQGQVNKEVIQQLQGKKTGLQDHGELINIHVVPYARLWRSTADAKVLMAVALYEMAKREGLLTKP